MARLKQAGPPPAVLTPPPIDPRHTPAGRSGAIPASADATAKAMTDAARIGTEGLPPDGSTAPGSQRHNIPERDSIVSSPGWNVP